jgi:hypothetical protein
MVPLCGVTARMNLLQPLPICQVCGLLISESDCRSFDMQCNG